MAAVSGATLALFGLQLVLFYGSLLLDQEGEARFFAAIGVGAWYLAQWRGWPNWAAWAVGLGAAGLILGVVFFRRWWLRRRERQFVKRVVEQDTAAISAAGGRRAGELGERPEIGEQSIRALMAAVDFGGG